MAAKKTLDCNAVLAAARTGELRGAHLKKVIKLAEEFGKADVAKELRLFVVDPASFAGDDAPAEIRDRFAQGLSALKALGYHPNRTIKMVQDHGILETMRRIGRNKKSTTNFHRLCAAGQSHLTCEAIVLDFPHLFAPALIDTAKKRLADAKSSGLRVVDVDCDILNADWIKHAGGRRR